jgi:acetyl/propionyl-CoA carboxylase alpha subunit
MIEPITLLIANRGEIAVRIHRAARALGMRTVAVHTAEDARALHVGLADEAHLIDSAAGYLDGEQIVDLAVLAGASLVHPGYGFLSESASFAALCEKAGLTFVGPTAETLSLLGDKASSRALAEELEVPVLPATRGATTLAEAERFMTDLGSDAAVMVKAIGGGGGRGMREVHRVEDLASAVERCSSEAERAFGRPDVYVEQLLVRARHVEVQVLGDGTGDVAHFWDRDCTIQRRNQKLVEIAPCVTLPLDAREPLLRAARCMAATVDYRGLGTFEFLVDLDDPERYYFLEANPRVQVEHTVTEAVTGVDLVAAQLEVALGRTLLEMRLSQCQVPEPVGIAVQTRVNLERLSADGSARASTGTITRFEVPTGPGVRVDTAGSSGFEATGSYDSLIAKVITLTGRGDLAAAAQTADDALADFRLDGPTSNIGLLREVLARPEFRTGTAGTSFVDVHLGELVADEPEAGVAAGSADEVRAPFAGTVVSVAAAPGETVAKGTPLLVIESMKMEHVVGAGTSGIVRELLVEVGDTVAEAGVLVRLMPDGHDHEVESVEAEVDLDQVRPDLASVLERHRFGLDEARPEAVAKRRRTGHRTARENLADLVDDGSFSEYGALTVAAQRQRRSIDDLIANTPADGMVTGIGRINGDLVGTGRSRAVVLSYDYTVLAGTQGTLNHKKTDRMLAIAERQQLPVVLFAEGGGGRPGDTDTSHVSGLDVTTFTTMGRLSGLVPSIGIVSGRCFAGNAALLGCCDVIIGTRDATLGMGGPAMIEGGGLGTFSPDEVGPMSVQVPNGVVDVLVEDEQEAVAVAKRYLSYFQGAMDDWNCADQRLLRSAIPENRVRAYDVRRVIELLADTDSVLELRPEFGRSVVTTLARLEGRPIGLVANDPAHLGGAIDAPSADKLARFLQLCDAHGLPVVSLCDTPGFMVGPESEKTATVRHFSRLFVTGAHLSVPLVAVVLRKGYGLGAQGMVGGGFHSPAATLAWPTGEIGGMGLEGAVRLGYRRELEAITDPAARAEAFDELLAKYYQDGKAVNAAAVFELDDVIDPADSRTRVVQALPPLGSTGAALGASADSPRNRRFIDTW